MNCFDTRKRIVWCPVGPLNLLPLHAAGVYETSPTGPSDHLSNYVVSSYTPTLTALHRAWFTDKERTPVNRPYPCVLAVAQPEVSAFNSLPMAREEVDTVKQLLSADHGIRALNISSSLSVASALEHLPNVEVLHLACHGQQDPNNPLNSGFELEDGRLTLSQLMKVNIPNAQLAYLSACETASTDETRPDESINLAAAMLFIGFKSVIATMW
jgi:CHAT domain-containing protein